MDSIRSRAVRRVVGEPQEEGSLRGDARVARLVRAPGALQEKLRRRSASLTLGMGDWGLGLGIRDSGLGEPRNPATKSPNPQPPTPVTEKTVPWL